MSQRASASTLFRTLGIVLCLFTVAEVNYPLLRPLSQLAIFAGFGLVLCFLSVPAHSSLRDASWARWSDRFLALLSALCSLYLTVQTEPLFERFWLGGQSLGNRAAHETTLDLTVGVLGLLLVLEATRRAIGPALPILASFFLAYAVWGQSMPDWLFPHRGYDVERIVSQTFLHSQGVFGIALRVMLTYVFLFVLFGALLQATGATGFIIRFTRRLFQGSSGGAAKVAVLSSGLMGSLSGSAVANTATTGTFTIPMMRGSGFKPHVAGGVEAAASSGGALVPPVMGAGAYMMLEIIEPQVTYLQIIRAALVPAILYYLSLFLIVHLYARKIGAAAAESTSTEPAATALKVKVPGDEETRDASHHPFAGIVFATSFVGLIVFLLMGYTPFRAVTLALGVVILISSLRAETRLSWLRLLDALSKSARDVIPLVSAASCVGIILGVVTLTGIGTRLPAAIVPLAEQNLMLALVAIMVSSIILGMGLPSAVCYLLMATLIGPVLGQLGVVPLAAHLFIFYFGMMSMVTPPVALAAYAAASIADSSLMKTSLAAFRFALVGFVLPYMFVLQPELLLLAPDGSSAGWTTVAVAVGLAVFGIVPFAAGIVGYLFAPLALWQRGVLLLSGLLLLLPEQPVTLAGLAFPILATSGAALLTVIALLNRRQARALA